MFKQVFIFCVPVSYDWETEKSGEFLYFMNGRQHWIIITNEFQFIFLLFLFFSSSVCRWLFCHHRCVLKFHTKIMHCIAWQEIVAAIESTDGTVQPQNANRVLAHASFIENVCRWNCTKRKVFCAWFFFECQLMRERHSLS